MLLYVKSIRKKETPFELEKLNMFPDDFTKLMISLILKELFMGNALVIGIVERLGNTLSNFLFNSREL